MNRTLCFSRIFSQFFATKFPKSCDSSFKVFAAEAVKSSKALSNRESSGFFLFCEDCVVGGGRDELGEGMANTSLSIFSVSEVSYIVSLSFSSSYGICKYNIVIKTIHYRLQI